MTRIDEGHRATSRPRTRSALEHEDPVAIQLVDVHTLGVDAHRRATQSLDERDRELGARREVHEPVAAVALRLEPVDVAVDGRQLLDVDARPERLDRTTGLLAPAQLARG